MSKTIILDKYFGINTQYTPKSSDIIYGDTVGSTIRVNSLTQLIKQNFPEIVDGHKHQVNMRFKITIEELPGVFDHVIQ
jgi:hypothetical protein